MITFTDTRTRLKELKFDQIGENTFENYEFNVVIQIKNDNDFIIDFTNEDCLLDEQRQWYNKEDLNQLLGDISKEI